MTDLITLPRATVQQALEALENSSPDQYPEDAGVFYDAKDALRAALEQPYAEQARRVEQETHGRMRIDPVTGDVSIGTPTEQEQEPVAFDALVAISLLTHLGGEVADYEDVVEAVRRLHALNGELGAALRRLISYCNTLENRLMEADGEHPAVQEAKEAWAKVEGKA
jgi:NTP pyrophosphatase (non-canonical NTP hydrolase)